ncbi:MAG: ExbD/TolR family protein [Alphaproteobacteria bacterium]|nr:ExbD/TolR family protein [Alphaproteobacteria bacterium]
MAMLMKSGGGRNRRKKPMAEINVTPFVDVMLVLLVVFMITAPLLATGVPVNLPKTSAKPLPTGQDTPLVVTVDKTGKVFVGEQTTPVELADLAPMLVAIAKENLEKRVYLRGDDAAAYGMVVVVMAKLQGAGFKNVNIVVDSDTMQRLTKGG